MRNVQLHEFNILMGRKVYLPNVSGMLAAYAVSQSEVANNYNFSPFLFIREEPERIVERWDNPSVLAFSSSMWNHELNIHLAKVAKERFPDSLIVFGGPHVPGDFRAEMFLKNHPFIDMTVLNEGEVTFAEVLKAFMWGRDFSEVEGVTFRHPSGEVIRTPDRSLVDVNRLPSPYLTGLYDELLSRRGQMEYQAIFETNRGCPFRCAFCAWGNSITKVRFFEIERLRQEINWFSKKEIPYIFGADANFGMFPRDREIADAFATIKRHNAYPKSFRVCYGKNATNKIYEVASILETNQLTTGVTLSFQSTDPDTLKIIHRDNIKVETYRELLCRYRQANIRVYTELILGLPGETYNSFSRGIEEVFQAGLYDQVGIFFCQVLPNTEMDNPEYSKTHGIKTCRIKLVETHASARRPEEVSEYEDIVIATNSLPLDDWKRAARLGWIAQVLHGLKLGFFVSLYLFNKFGIRYTELFEYLIVYGTNPIKFPIFNRELGYYTTYLEELISGKPQCVFLPDYGEISWQVEEATFLHLSEDLNGFYGEFEELTQSLLESRGIQVTKGEISDLFKYQSARMASYKPRPSEYIFGSNFPEYFQGVLSDLPVTLVSGEQSLKVTRSAYSDKKEFAMQVIWYGRRNCRAVEPVTWS